MASIDPDYALDAPRSRPLSTHSPSPPRALPLELPSTDTPDEPPTTSMSLEEWREPEAGFEAISLDDGTPPPPPAPPRRASDTSVNSVTSSAGTNPHTERTMTPPISEVASTAPTTQAPTSPVSASSPTSPSPSKHRSTTPPLPTTHESDAATPKKQEGGGMSRPPDSTKVEQPSPAKQAQNAKAPSVMQKIISMTRQRDLPPKSRDEEEKHLKELADMLAASKEAEKRRRSELDSKAAARASALAAALPTWEASILPNWRAVLHDTSEGRHLRKLWWSGTMPVRFRGRLWSLCIGNGLAISKNAYSIALARALKGIEEARAELVEFKRDAEEDMEKVLPTLKLFQKNGGVMHQDLVELLLAWSVHNTLEPIPRYPKGLAYPASLLLVNMPPSEAFVSLLNLISKSFLKAFYSPSTLSLHSYERVFDTLLADSMPKVYSNFSSSVVRPSLYLVPWLTTLFVGFLPLELTTRLFDVFLLEGDSFMFRTSLALLQILEPRLFNPNLRELEMVFEGKDQGAVAIVKREKGLLSVGGGGGTLSSPTTTGGNEAEGVEVEDVYTEMGCTEERVFELLEKLDWKEETWERLVERELPDAD